MGTTGQDKKHEAEEAKKRESRRMNIAAVVVGIFTAAVVITAICLNAGIRMFSPLGGNRGLLSDTEGGENYIFLGEYPQSEVTGADLTEEIMNASYDQNGDASVNGTRYRRVSSDQVTYHAAVSTEGYDVWQDDVKYRYFVYEPLRWRILEVTEEGQALLLADQVIDCRCYHNTSETVSWIDTDLFYWLNGSFYDTAFKEAEQNMLRETENGKVFLLDMNQLNDYILLSPEFKEDDVRVSCTSYAKCMGAYDTGNGDAWWYLRFEEADYSLRTGSLDGTSISSIMANGENIGTGIRPAVLADIN